MNSNTEKGSGQDDAVMAQWWYQQLILFTQEMVVELDQILDKRLVRTFVRLMQAIIVWRHRSLGLVLSEVGGYLLTAQ